MKTNNNLNDGFQENKKQLSIYLPENLYNSLTELALIDDRPLVNYIRCVLKDHVRATLKED